MGLLILSSFFMSSLLFLINCSFYFLLHVYLGRKFTNSALYDFFMTYTFLFRSSNLLKTWAYLRVYWKVQSCVFLLILRKSEQWFSKHFASSFFNSKYIFLSLFPYTLFLFFLLLLILLKPMMSSVFCLWEKINNNIDTMKIS